MTAGPEPYSLVNDRRPLYLQAVEALRRYISYEGVASGDRLPSEAEFARMLGVGRSTIREAMGLLELAGLIERRRGVGTVVVAVPPSAAVGLETLESFESLASRQGWTCTTEGIQIERFSADRNQAHRLGIPEGSPLTIIERTKLRDGDPIAEMTSIVPDEVLPHEMLRDEFRDSITELMLRRRDVRLRYAQAMVSAVACMASMATRLDLPEGDPLIVIDELFLGDGDKPLAWNLLYLVPGKVELQVVRRAGPHPVDPSSPKLTSL